MTQPPPPRTAAPPHARRLDGVATRPCATCRPWPRGRRSSASRRAARPELFDLDGVRAAFDAVLSGPRARQHLQYAPTEGDGDLRELLAERLTAAGCPRRRRPAGDHGSQQALALLATALLDPETWSPWRSPPTSRRCRASRWPGPAWCPSRATTTAWSPPTWPACSSRSARGWSTWSPPSPTHRAHPQRRAPRGGGRARRGAPRVARRGRPVRRAPLPRHPAARAGRRARRRGPHRLPGQLLQGGGPGHAPGVGCGPRRGCGGRSWWPSRRPTCTPPPSTRPPRPRTWPSATSTRTSRACAPSTAPPRRGARGAAGALPEGSTWSDPDGGMFVWARLPVAPTRRRCSRGRWSATWPSSPEPPSSPGRPTAPPSACRSPPTRRSGSPRGCAAWPGARSHHHLTRPPPATIMQLRATTPAASPPAVEDRGACGAQARDRRGDGVGLGGGEEPGRVGRRAADESRTPGGSFPREVRGALSDPGERIPA